MSVCDEFFHSSLTLQTHWQMAELLTLLGVMFR